MIFIKLFITFFEIGLFGFGGGYGMLSLIQHETVESHHWLSTAEFTDIVAISQMTPGPIGINSATYCGYTAIHNAGYGHLMAILGSATATFALVLPSLILMILISRMFMKYMNTPLVKSVFTGLRPAVVGLLAAATLLLCNVENFSTPVDFTASDGTFYPANPWQFFISCALFAATAFGTGYLKINPIRMICYAGIAGLLLLY
jgi:chromate transporter